MKRHPVLFFFALYVVLAGIGAWLIVRSWGLHWLLAWFISCNVVVLPMWAWDKLQSGRQSFRIPELALHLCALTGATPASYAAMHWLHHKSLKPSFRVLYGAFVVVQVAVVAFWLGRNGGAG